MSLFLASSRLPVSHLMSQSGRSLSTQGSVAIEKLRCVFEEYRQQNYQLELPTRFKKEILAAAAKQQTSTDFVGMDGLQRVLINIGAESRLSQNDVKIIFKELGNDMGEISITRMTQIL